MDKLNKFLDFKMVDGKTIPKIPLYMDQVTGYLDKVFEEIKRNDEEKILTKTMINNYVKAKIIDSPEKKKYDDEQIRMLMMIYMLKNTIQIQEIDTLLKHKANTSDLFESVIDFDKEARLTLKDTLNQSDASPLDQILKLLLSANIQKKAAEILLDHLNKD